ncbi:DNA-directed RNA polymerase subunit alpha [Patescibacteria group bacterium AH-259-L07]|nr:DNA-directed RNA polymerase subunit alpha [Patescibacteria group bacterium AH-259-L07]
MENNIFLPKKVEYQEDTQDKNKGSIIIEPCYPGYGTTWGNALRRVLLVSLEGVAVTAVKIKGVKYEFSTIDYVQEDVLDIILNLKTLRFKARTDIDEPVKLTLKASGSKKVRAGDIDTSADVEVVSKDLVIATLTDKRAKLEMELWVSKGYGWVPSEEKSREKFDVSTIITDSIFTPIVKVATDVENVRVGKRTDYDRLILSIQTDGSLSPLEAFRSVSRLLEGQFSYFIELSQKLVAKAEKKPKKKKAKTTTKEKPGAKKKTGTKKSAPKKKTTKKSSKN